jgi:hypothetical protein
MPIKQGKRALNPSGLIGALGMLSTFGFVAEEILAPMVML